MTRIILAARGGITTYHEQQLSNRSRPHRGIDQGHGNMTEQDRQIKAPAGGVVTAVGPEGSYGDRIVILHDDGTTSLLAHHAEQFVAVGQRVARGQIIAVMGNSGTRYVHSHQEYRDTDGTQLDPLEHLGSALASATLIALAQPVTRQIGSSTMKVILHTTHASDGSGKVTGIMHYKVGELTVRPLITQAEVDVAISVYGPATAVDDARFDSFISTVNDNLAAIRA
ncbi:M23 family metallopeptidase [Cryobacterium sp. Y57]|uniref:M23 family metallopeptidase n=1 Tax=Cryobacterium sp. Y57 TaxID=2048287 RepID=UPI001304F02E|nr:M23 family metallopeptidase [Cryobacterium sp. Y57]